MRISIASYGGRNWLLELARELEKQGHDVKFYSYLPNKRALKFGLKKECNHSYFILALPFLALLKITNHSFWALYLFHLFFDFYISIILSPCDIFIGQSPMHVKSLRVARSKYKAKIIIERGTSHVLNYMEVLGNNPAFKGKEIMPKMFLKRDLEGYEIADYISVPSKYVADSFIKHGISKNKIFVNNFGVDLSKFQGTMLDSENVFDIIIVGQWSYRKGGDLLAQLCKNYKIRLLHVGAIIDVDFPKLENMTHIESVDEFKLLNYYKKAKVFVLPSREEGLALVQPQALMCGLPIVCSKNTGGIDLKKYLEDEKWIIEMQEYTVEELYSCITKAIALSNTQQGIRTHVDNLSKNLSWLAYGERYNNFLIEKCSK